MLKGKNKRKMFKKALCLSFALLISINTFAAVVSDNDGGAFITKAEFEALKADFNEQVFNYNKSIDSKIDGAIAAYLAGLRLSQTITLDNYINDLDSNLRTFMNRSSAAFKASGDTWRLNAGVFLVSWVNQLSGIRHDDYQGMIRYSLFTSNPDDTKLSYKTVDHGNTDYKWLVDKYEINGTDYYYPHYLHRMKLEHWVSIVSPSVSRTNSANSVDVSTATTNIEWDISKSYPSTESKVGDWTNFYGTSAPRDLIIHTSNIYDPRADIAPLKYLIGKGFDGIYNAKLYCVEYAKRTAYDGNTQVVYEPNPGSICVFKYNPDGEAQLTRSNVFNAKIKFYPQKLYEINFVDLINEGLTKRLFEPVTRCDGLAICRTDQAGDVHINLNLTSVKAGDTDLAAPTDLSGMTYIVEIKNSKWGTDEPTTTKRTDSVYYKNNVTEGTLDILIEKTDKKETTYWLKIVPSLNAAGVQVEVKESYIEVK